MAVNHAVWILNNLPGDNGLSAEEKFSGQKLFNYDNLRSTHVWGAPVYVLDPALQNGSKLPKFKARSRQGQFLGYSSEHSSSVGLILNRQTGRISPQFHVVYDDYFQTVRGLADSREVDLDAIDWESFISVHNTENLIDEDDLVADQPSLLQNDWKAPFAADITPDVDPPAVATEGAPPLPSRDTSVAPLPSRAPPLLKTDGPPLPVHHSDPVIIIADEDDATVKTSNIRALPAPTEGDFDVGVDAAVPSPDLARAAAKDGLRRSACLQQVPLKNYNEDFLVNPHAQSFFTSAHAAFNAKRKFTRSEIDAFEIGQLDWNESLALLASSPVIINGDSRRFFSSMDILEDPLGLGLDDFPTFGLVNRLSAASADNPRFQEAMSGPNVVGFLAASVLEVSSLHRMDAWTQVVRLPSMNVLPSTWAFKIKRFSNGLQVKSLFLCSW